MALEIIMVSEINQKEKLNTVWSHTYMESKTNKKAKTKLRDIENRLVVARDMG